ncbi:hypothetical protein [Pseudomonas sp. NA-150]|uniref:hypothetical protein n=1 Tax=Pseudomonas sp. NA-150 TaxID=3367525 RepID=UPI0037CC4D3D
METAPPVPLTLSRHMPDKAALWLKIAERHNLIQPDLARLVGWGFGDFIFHTETDIISDTNKSPTDQNHLRAQIVTITIRTLTPSTAHPR